MCERSSECEHVQLATTFAEDLRRQFNEERAKNVRQSLVIASQARHIAELEARVGKQGPN